MPDRTVEDLVADSVRVLDAAPLEREWRRRAFAALLAFNDEFDTRSGRDVLHEPLARAGLLEAGAKDVRPLPLPEVAVEVCRHLAEPRKRHLVAAWYKVLGISMAERDRLSALRRNAAARELRELARALNAVEVPVSGYEPGGSDVGGSADFAWWFEAPERSREAPSAAEAIAYARALDANQPPATRFGTLVLPEGSNAMCQALAAGGSEVPLALMDLLESPSTGYFSSI